jgi:hypothetical protein
MLNLCVAESANFQFSQHKTGMMLGTFSSHLRKLKQSVYVEMTKEVEDAALLR